MTQAVAPNVSDPVDRPRVSTKIALATALAAAIATGWGSELIPLQAVAVIVVLVAAAQLIGNLPGPAAAIARWPTTVIALVLLVASIYVSAQFGFAAGSVVAAMALFVLSLDWNNLARLPMPLLVSLLVVTASLMHGITDVAIPALLVWTAAVITTLVFIERDNARGTERLHFRRHPAAAGQPASEAGGGAGAGLNRRRVLEIASITLLLLIIVPLLAFLIPDAGNSSRPNRLGNPFSDQRQSSPYWGFQDQLDTSVRGGLDNEVVMRVQAPAPDLWRGTTFDRWDGRVWTKTTGPARGYPGYGNVQIAPSIGDPVTATAPNAADNFTQVVTIERSGTDLIFGAYRPNQVEMDEPATVDHNDGTVRGYGALPAGSVYTVTSSRPDITADRLRREDPLRQPIPAAIRSLYLPDEPITPRVKQLADDVAAAQPTTYDKVTALESWMGANTTYSRDIPRPPDGADAVDQFLFVDRKGFCEQIASSLAVMLRSQGIPTRVAAGYAPGDRNPFTGEFTERSSDAHSWVEVWFPETGWQAFDPTASVPLSGEIHETWLDAVVRIARAVAWWLAALAVVLVVGLVVVLVARQRRRSHDRRVLPWADLLTQRLLRAGASRDRPRRSTESLIEYSDRLATSVLVDPRVGELGRLLSAALFAGPGRSVERREWATAVLDEVERANPPRQVRKRQRDGARAERRAARDGAAAEARQHERVPLADQKPADQNSADQGAGGRTRSSTR